MEIDVFPNIRCQRSGSPQKTPPPLSDPDPFSPPRSRKAEKAPKEVKEAHSRTGIRTSKAHLRPIHPGRKAGATPSEIQRRVSLRCRKANLRSTPRRKTAVSRTPRGGADGPLKCEKLSFRSGSSFVFSGSGRPEFSSSSDHLSPKPILSPADQPGPTRHREGLMVPIKPPEQPIRTNGPVPRPPSPSPHRRFTTPGSVPHLKPPGAFLAGLSEV